jgi:hypothetical protein
MNQGQDIIGAIHTLAAIAIGLPAALLAAAGALLLVLWLWRWPTRL